MDIVVKVILLPIAFTHVFWIPLNMDPQCGDLLP
nr:MAG: hypothetical protein H3Bulk401080_000002 [Mitovirus sp.]